MKRKTTKPVGAKIACWKLYGKLKIKGIHNTVNKIIILDLNNIIDNVNGLEINIYSL